MPDTDDSSDAYREQIQSLSLGAEVTLYEVDMTDLGGPLERFTPMTDEGNLGGVVQFGGNDYNPFPIIAGGFEWSGQSATAQPTVTISNLDHAMTGYILTHDNLIGAQFRRIRTFETFLDNGATPDGNSHQPIDVYRFERKTAHDNTSVTWDLSSWVDQQGIMLPGRQVIRDWCSLRYRRYVGGSFDYSQATCPYAGSNYFDRNDDVTADPAEDYCSHLLSGCKLRFTGTTARPFGGFPGVAKYRV